MEDTNSDKKGLWQILLGLVLLLFGGLLGWTFNSAWETQSSEIEMLPYLTTFTEIGIFIIALYGLHQWRRERIFISTNKFNFFKVKHRRKLRGLAYYLLDVTENHVIEVESEQAFEASTGQFNIDRSAMSSIRNAKKYLDDLIDDIDAAVVELCAIQQNKDLMFEISESFHYTRYIFEDILTKQDDPVEEMYGPKVVASINIDKLNNLITAYEFLISYCNIDKTQIESMLFD